MADAPVIHIGENSPEKVAYTLMIDVFNAEKVKFDQRTRALVLDAYAECLEAVKGHRDWRRNPQEY